MKSAHLEVLSDTIGAARVIASGVIILTTKFYLADPLISIGLAVFILLRTRSLIKKSIHILMEGVPANLSPEEVKNAILDTPDRGRDGSIRSTYMDDNFWYECNLSTCSYNQSE